VHRCVWLIALAVVMFGQEPDSLRSVKRIYIDGLGDKPGLREVKKDLSTALRRTDIFAVADSPSDADATLSGRGDVWLKGYYSLNPRSGTSPANGQPIYGGYVSVELKDRTGATLWSYLATLRTGSKNIGHDLSKDVVKHLLTAYGGTGRH
jgi:hypothetical protein